MPRRVARRHRELPAKDPAERPSVGEVAAYAGARTGGQTTPLASRTWLLRPVAESLGDYSASNAPPRRLLHPVILLPAALLISVGAVLGFVAGHTSGVSAEAAGPATAPDDGYV